MSAALALNHTAPVVVNTKEARPALSLVHVAEMPLAQLNSQRLKKRVAVRSRLANMVESAASLALFHAYRA
jgi:hypothetical protein